MVRDITLAPIDPEFVLPGPIYYWMEPEEIQELCMDLQNELMDNMRLFLVAGDKNVTYTLFNSIKANVEGKEYTITVDAPYGYPVEFGLPPGELVSYHRMYNWVVKKFHIMDPVRARKVAFKVRQKIFNKGIRPYRFMKKAILLLGRKNRLIVHRQRAPKPKKKMTIAQQIFPGLRKRKKKKEAK